MDEPEFYSVEKAKRRRIRSTVQVIVIAATDQRIAGLPGGSIVVITAHPGGDDVRNIIDCSVTKNYSALGKLIAQILTRRQSLRRTRKLKLHGLHQLTTLSELHYSNSVVAGGLFSMPETGTMATIAPFVGGLLQHTNFRIESFVIEAGTALEHVVLIRQPILTEIERDITSRIPNTFSGELIGSADFAAFPGALAAVVEVGLDWVVHELGDLFAHKAMDDIRKANEELERQVLQDANNQDQQQQDQQQQDQQRQDLGQEVQVEQVNGGGFGIGFAVRNLQVLNGLSPLWPLARSSRFVRS